MANYSHDRVVLVWQTSCTPGLSGPPAAQCRQNVRQCACVRARVPTLPAMPCHACLHCPIKFSSVALGLVEDTCSNGGGEFLLPFRRRTGLWVTSSTVGSARLNLQPVKTPVPLFFIHFAARDSLISLFLYLFLFLARGWLL